LKSSSGWYQTSLSQPGPRYKVKAKKEIILSAGSINTPQLLMLSGIGDRNELSKFGIETVVDLPSVGRNLTDHPFFTSQWEVINNTHTFEDAEQNSTIAAEQLSQWITNGTGPLVSGASNQIGWLRLPSNSSIFNNVADPSAGPTSGHFELLFSVSHYIGVQAVID
jgi:choline dehydrogenase-like flavoprotein